VQITPNLFTSGGYQYFISGVSVFTYLLYIAFIFCEKRFYYSTHSYRREVPFRWWMTCSWWPKLVATCCLLIWQINININKAVDGKQVLVLVFCNTAACITLRFTCLHFVGRSGFL